MVTVLSSGKSIGVDLSWFTNNHNGEEPQSVYTEFRIGDGLNGFSAKLPFNDVLRRVAEFAVQRNVSSAVLVNAY